LTVLLLIGMSGCASVEKKFIRKKKVPAHIPAVVYIEQGPYQKKYSSEYYYKSHFTYWKSWQEELVNNLGANQKKVSRCAEEAWNHLTEMNKYLVPAKQAELAPNLESLGQIAAKISGGNYSRSEKGDLRAELEKIQRIVSNNFYYDKVKNDLVPDNVDLSASNSNTSPAAPQSAPVK
jgi:hypothetical protein